MILSDVFSCGKKKLLLAVHLKTQDFSGCQSIYLYPPAVFQATNPHGFPSPSTRASPKSDHC